MKKLLLSLTTLLAITAFAQQTLPPSIVKLKGATDSTPIGNVGDSIKVNVTNGSGGGTVNQGTGGLSPWLMHFDNTTIGVTGTFFQATQPVSGSLGRTWSLLNTTDSVNVGNFPSTQPVSGSLGRTWTLLNSTDSVNVGNFPSTQAVTGTFFQATQPISGSVSVSNFPSTQPISGTVTANAGTGTFTVDGSGHTQPVSGTFFQATQPVSAVSLPLPTGASTSALQSTINTTLGAPFQVGGSIGNTSFAATQSTGSNLHTDVDNFPATQPVSAASLPLPTGASTSALQSTAVANQTNGTQVTSVNNFPASQVVTQSTAANLNATVVGTVTANQPPDTLPATQSVTTQDLVSITTAQANSQNAITGTPTAGSAASFALSSYDAVEVQATGSWTGTIQTEVSMDGGTTWFTRGVKQSGASYLVSSFTQNFEGGLNFAGMTNFRVRAIAPIVGSITIRVVGSVNPGSIVVTNPLTLRDSTTQSVANTIKAASTSPVGTDTALVVVQSPNGNQATAANQTNGNQINQIVSANSIATYAACTTNLAISSTPTDIFTITGSATKLVTVLRVEISGTETTVSMHEFDLIVRSSANIGGTFSNPTNIPHDSNDAAATAVVSAYTVSPTILGTTVGTIWSKKFVIPAGTGVDSSWPQFFEVGELSQGIVLRGTAQTLAVSDNDLAIAGSSLNICVKWTEQ